MAKTFVFCLLFCLASTCLAQNNNTEVNQPSSIAPSVKDTVTDIVVPESRATTPPAAKKPDDQATDPAAGTTKQEPSPKKEGAKESLVENVMSSGLCQTCSCGDVWLTPLVVNCSHRGLEDAFNANDWPHDVLVSSIAINLASNKLYEIRQFPVLPIHKLNMRDNNIQFIERAAFKYLKSLDYLDLTKNSLTHDTLTRDTFEGTFVENDYEPVPLRVLRLGYNQIHSIDKDAFDHLSTHLEVLELNNNPIKIIDHQTAIAITSLRKLKKLNLAETEISNLPEGLLHALPNLKILILSGNQFNVVPAELQRAIFLEELNINNNPITKLDVDSFQGLSLLRKLNVSAMPNLRKIDRNAFTPLQSMTHLWCSFNPALKVISSSAFANMGHSDNTLSLSEFHFQENKIKYLPRNLLPWNDTDVVDIQGNPFVCDCHIGWVVTELLPLIMKKEPELTLGLGCAEPVEYAGRTLDSLGDDKAIANCADIVDTDNGTDDDSGHPIRPPPVPRGSNSGVIMLSILGMAAVVGGVACLFLFLTFKKSNLRRLYDTGSGQIVHYVRTAGGAGKADDEHAIVEREFTQYSADP